MIQDPQCKNWSRDPDYAPFRVVQHRNANHQPTHTLSHTLYLSKLSYAQYTSSSAVTNEPARFTAS